MVKVQVAQGWLEGEHLETLTGDTKYYSFKGIPFAEPPLGKLRFKAPRAPLPWNGVRKATEHGPVCPQMDLISNSIISGSEDCLYLNIYSTDLKPNKPKTVLFFIHGGGYAFGSGNDDHYGPDFLVAHDVVLVTTNYRLGPLGFLCLDTPDVPGNAGLKDQVAALKWVQENISNFGGDPNDVTIFGESAGGASVVYHVLSPLSKGLFKRAIAMSGVRTCDWAQPYQPRRRAFTLGKLLGINTKNSNELLNYLQNVPTAKLITPDPCIISSEEQSYSVRKMYHFNPVVEKDLGKDHFLTEKPMHALKNGRFNKVDILVGNTSEEYLLAAKHFEGNAINIFKQYPELFVPREVLINAKPDVVLELSDRIINHYFGDKKVDVDALKEIIRFASESSFGYDIYRFISNMPQVGGVKRFFYKFGCVSERNVYSKHGSEVTGIKAASHLEDLMYLFNAKYFGLDLKKGSKEYELVQFVCKVFTNFAKYGNPTPDKSLGVVWPEYDNATMSYGELTDTLTIKHNLATDVLKFWKSIFDYAGVEF